MDGSIGFRRSKTIEMKVSLIIIAIQFFLLNFKMAAGGHLEYLKFPGFSRGTMGLNFL